MLKKNYFLLLLIALYSPNINPGLGPVAASAPKQEIGNIRATALRYLQELYTIWIKEPHLDPHKLNPEKSSYFRFNIPFIFEEYFPKISQEERNLIEKAFPSPFIEFLNAVSPGLSKISNKTMFEGNPSLYANPKTVYLEIRKFKNFSLKNAIDAAQKYQTEKNKEIIIQPLFGAFNQLPKDEQETLKKMFPSISFDQLKPKYDALQKQQRDEDDKKEKARAIQYSPLNVYTQNLNSIKQQIESLNDSINRLLDQQAFVKGLLPLAQKDPQLANRNLWLKRDMPAIIRRLKEITELLPVLVESLPEKP